VDLFLPLHATGGTDGRRGGGEEGRRRRERKGGNKCGNCVRKDGEYGEL
jgi:hypothetical protein